MKKTFKMLWGLVLFLLCVEVEAAKGPTIDSVENKDNDFIDEILEKVIDAPIKKKSLFKKDKRDER